MFLCQTTGKIKNSAPPTPGAKNPGEYKLLADVQMNQDKLPPSPFSDE